MAAHDGVGSIARESYLHCVFLLYHFGTRYIVEPLFWHDIYTTIPEAEWCPDVQDVDLFPGFNPPN
jgi:hypothetical protein